ncbi:hypothetical protein I309_00276 [Cryptococcus deuterogattii LA55]|nr:hypothetical protein I309_00276 [Cryptococcus deuterogattii LA55]KIR35609.1 hypothetical protein I352_01886 [Cryptococcus deuterogattii MMRL2647]KIR72835.1 hypothetical protein I310_03437 [Cryptococcus deuterogattii CA1014]KIR94984.1 hypothetical protein I304_01310 [Cryptococcus deuterogattii CBS 10090]
MSTSSDSQYTELEGFNFTGGLPNSSDLAPSVIFIIALNLHLLSTLRIGLFAAILTAIVGSSLIGNAIDDSSMMDTVNALRRASMILSMVVVAISFVATLLTHLHFSLTLRGTMWLYSVEACMIIVTVYKLAQFESSDPDAAARSIVTFWVLQILFEFIAFVLIVAIPIPQWFPGPDRNVEFHDRDMETGSKPSMLSVQNNNSATLV